MAKKYVPDVTIQRNMKRLFAERNVTQQSMAKLCGVDRKTVGKWVNGLTSPKAIDIVKICEYFDISADELLGIRR